MPNQPEHILENADIQWQDSGAPYSTHFDDIYFSRQGGLEETEYVFIAGNALTARWQAQDQALAQAKAEQNTFTIAELGFGTGLNFLCTWRAWRSLAPEHLRLHYIACEKFPLQRDALHRALQEWPELAEFSAQLLSSYPDHSHGYHRLHLHDSVLNSSIIVDLYYGDAEQLLSKQSLRASAKVDAWFLDGFAPKLNPQMWSEGLFAQIGRLSKAGTTLSSYSVAGTVVRSVRSAGFEVKKIKGFAQKRHMLTATFTDAAALTGTANAKPLHWLDIDSSPMRTSKELIIIGAGLAGCALAHSLARKGFKILVLEQAEQIANGASGNRQAVLQCRLSNADNGNRQFNLQAFLYAVREFNQLQQQHPEINWHSCGVLNLESAFKARQQRGVEVNHAAYADQIVQALNTMQCSEKAGLPFASGAQYLPLGGYLNPAQLCHAYLQHPNIRLQLNSHVTALVAQGQRWQVLYDNPTSTTAMADAVVIANSYSAAALSQTAALPIVPIRGQVSYVAETAHSKDLQSVVCGRSYICPAWQGLHSVGASYSKNISDLALSQKEHRENLEGIAHYLDSAQLREEAIMGGRVSIRATSTDRMPMVGAVPDFAQLESIYQEFGQTQRKNPKRSVPMLNGLYVSVSHGSHGLCNTPLAGEYLASLIANELLPVQEAVVKSLHPARFALRALKRQGFAH